MLAWFMYGTFMWWVITIVTIVTIFIIVEKDELVGAIVGIAFYLVYLQFLAGINVLEQIDQNRLLALAYIGG